MARRLASGSRGTAGIILATMASTAPPPLPPAPAPHGSRGFARAWSWRRVRTIFLLALFTSLPLCIGWGGSYRALLARLLISGLLLLLVFAVFERHPAKLPDWLERWVLQVIAVAFVVPFVVGIAYMFTSWGYTTSFGADTKRQMGFAMIVGACLLVAPWAALAALFRQVSGQARNRELAFALERSQLERQALDARVRLLQGQVEPHFLFNTLANVRELVDSGSPQASAVLASLIAYLRAAVPRLDAETATLGQELELVRAYLEVMQMRIPDRLQFLVQAEPSLHELRFPAMGLLTLVENAVRHGIDPAEEGGRIEVRVRRDSTQLHVQVLDTGVGLGGNADAGGGTGLANLRERLLLLYRGRATLVLLPLSPHGTSAEIVLPFEPGAAS
jgi:sensor histidine kinase YesM